MTEYILKYECPHGCKGQGDKPVAATIRGWKKHMTRNHEGYSESELAAIIMTETTKDSTVGRETFLSEAETDPSLYIKDGAVTDKPPQGSIDAETEARKTVELKTDAAAKKFNAKLNKMKKALADKFPTVVAGAVRERGPEWQLESDDTEILSEAVENCFDVLDIDFRIAPYNMVLSNPLWVLLLPILALVIVFAPKAVKSAQLHKEDQAAERKND